MIRDFAKANKMSGPKLVDFASQLFATIQPNSYSKAGKKVSPHMAEVRKSVTEYLLSADKFTTIDIANKVGCSVLEANSALTYAKQSFKIEVIGKADKEGKGKKPNIYQVSQ